MLRLNPNTVCPNDLASVITILLSPVIPICSLTKTIIAQYLRHSQHTTVRINDDNLATAQHVCTPLTRPLPPLNLQPSPASQVHRSFMSDIFPLRKLEAPPRPGHPDPLLFFKDMSLSSNTHLHLPILFEKHQKTYSPAPYR